MRRITSTILLAVAAISLAACSASVPTSDGTSPVPASTESIAPPSSSSPSPTPTSALSTSIDGLAEQLGLTDFAMQTTAAPGAISWGKGNLDGSAVKVYEFADDAGYQAFLASVAGFGISEAQLVHTGLFAIAPDNQDQLELIRTAVG